MNSKFLSFVLVFSLLFCLNIDAQKKTTATKQPAKTQVVKREQPNFVTSVEGIKEYSLSNGLQILLVPDATQSNVVVNIVYKVGSRHEGYGEKGMAHLLEHMLFKSTKNLGDIKKMLTDKGGNANGTTWYDRTNYYEIFPSNEENLRWSIEMEADRMINATMLQSDLDKEFSVVRNEFEIGENEPSSVLQERILSTAYLWHNYGSSTIGSKEDIERVKADRLKVFYQKYYQPDNAVLMIGGKFDEANALKYVAQYFSVIPKPTRILDKTYTIEPAQDGERYVELRRNGDVYSIGVVYHTAAFADKDYAAIDALVEVLTSDPSGYLYKSLIDTHLATNIEGHQPTLRDAAFAYFYLSVPKEKNIDEIKTTFVNELNKIGTTAYTEEDLNRAKAKLLKSIENITNNTLNKVINATEIIGAGDYRLFFIYRDNVEKLTLDDLNRVAKKYFLSNNRTLGVFIPAKEEIRVKSDEITDEQIAEMVGNYEGKVQDEELKSFEASIANIKANLTEKTLANGLKYGIVNKSLKGKKVVAQFRIPCGTAESLAGKGVVFSAMVYLMKTGTATMTKAQIQDKLDQLKSSIGFGKRPQDLYISVNTYEEYAPQVFALLNDILKNSTFPQNEFDKLMEQFKSSIDASRNDPQSLASTEISRLSDPYPESSIFYTPTLDETLTRIEKITREQVMEMYKMIGAKHGVGTIVSGLSAEKVQALVENAFENWTTTTEYVKVLQTFFPTKETYKEIQIDDKENAVNFGTINFQINESSPEYPALEIANEILGSGGFLNSRIAKRLRENEGISYGAGADISVPVKENTASWFSYAFYNPTKKSEVNAALKDEVSKAIASGFTAEEMKDAIGSWKNGRNTSLGTDGMIISLTNKHLFFDTPLEEFDELEKKVDALKVADLNAVIKKYLNLDQLIMVNAGDFKKE
ncbi:MAG: insulinase family protein [Candidatus Symbiothrix sp.]|jgi:zinc protease|nr:insulinase family protein [Candidatus Symbiothrix sp.]